MLEKMLEKLSFTKRYVLALSIIALLSALAFFNLNHLLSIQSNDAKLIDTSGRQRILTKQIAFFAIYYKIDKLEDNINLMEKAHQKLTSYSMSEELSYLYFGKEPYLDNLDNKVKKYLFHAKKFSENRNGRSQNYVLQNSEDLLLTIEKAVSIYLKEAEANTEKLKKVELYIFLVTLATLLFEAFFIFMPANRRINKKTEELTREKDYSNAVIESSTNAIITLDNKLKIRTYNKKAQSIFGYTKDQMLNHSSFGKIIPQKQNFKELGVAKEIEAINKKGKKFPIRISFGTSGENKDIEIVANIEDITKEKLNSKLLQQQAKFAALGEMIAVIAHQWRQPLAQLSFNCMYIKKQIKDPVLIKEAQKNEEIIQFMSETITNFQNFYKKTDNTTFNPIVSIEQALNLMESTLNLNQVKLIKEIDSKINIYGNANSLAHVVLSIVQNIIDVIKIRKTKNPFIHILLKDTKKHIALTIKDNAGGINVAPIGDIFKPFNSKKQTPSTGIGLYMSKLVIEDKFNGKIKAQNANNGALFVIHLPH